MLVKDALLENVPGPVHVPGDPEPLSCTGNSVVQAVWLGPALAEGAGVKLMRTSSNTALQSPAVVVDRRSTNPLEMSVGVAL